MSHRKSNSKAVLAMVAAVFVVSAAMIGCGAGTPFTASPRTQAVSGMAHGGRQPISGATVTLWQPGISGYGSAATQLAQITTGTNGSFSFTPADYTTTCTAGSEVYVTASGGNPGNSTGNSNPDVLLVAPLGVCGSLVSNTNIDEVTTVATVFALSGFVNSANFGSATATLSDSIGTAYSATPTFANNNNNVNGMMNAFNTVFNLANTTTGYTPGSASNATVDTAKINTLANILAACVNSDPTNGDTICSTLFTNVSPSVSPATPEAGNTFEAAYYLATNPTSMAGSTSNLAAVYGTAVPTSPYGGGLSAQPSDWTIGVNYAVSGLSAGQRLAIDALGNIWVTSAGQITELSPTGDVDETYTGTVGSTTITSPFGVAIDLNGNALVTDSGANDILEFNQASYVATIQGSTTASEEPYAIAIDKNNTVWFTSTNTNAANGTQTALLYSCAYTSGSFCTSLSPTGGNSADPGPFGIAIDQNSTIWLTSQYFGYTSATPGKSGRIGSHNGSTGIDSTNYYGTQPAKVSQPFGVVFDAGNANLWYSNAGNPSAATSFVGMAVLTQNTYPTPDTIVSTPTSITGGGVNMAHYLAMDGNSRVWVANSEACATCTPQTYSVSEFTDAGVAISPATTGFVHTMVSPNDIAVDGSGNVWVVSSSTSYVTEIIGVATPAVTPIAYDTTYGTWGERP